MIGGVLTGVFLIAAGILLSRSISRPLKTITVAAQSIAEGDISVAVPAADGGDEIGTLACAFRQMVRTLQDLAAAAERTAAGDLTGAVKPQSDKDVMALAVAKMLENLRKSTRLIRDCENGEDRKLCSLALRPGRWFRAKAAGLVLQQPG